MGGGSEKRICVARIGAPHGVRGEVRLWSYTADPMTVGDYGPLETADSRRLEIEALRPAKDCLIARLAGVADRDAAERLKNAELFVPRERLPAPAEDEFYHADLIGLVAVTRAGREIGKVCAVHNFGGGDLLEIGPEQGGTFMLPFTEAVVPVVDIAGGRIIVDPVEGWLQPSSPAGEGGEPRAEQASGPGRDRPLRRFSPVSPSRTTLSRKGRR